MDIVARHPTSISVCCHACGEVVPVVIEGARMPIVRGADSTFDFRPHHWLCGRHLRERTAARLRDDLAARVQLGTGLKLRAGIPPDTTGWLLGPTDGPQDIRLTILCVAVPEWPDDQDAPSFGVAPPAGDPRPSLFAIASIVAQVPDLAAFWEWDWAVMLPGSPALPEQSHDRHLIRRKCDRDRFDAVRDLMWDFTNRGGRPQSDSDIEAAIRAIADEEEPTSGRVAKFLYPYANDPYDSLYKRLNGRDGRPFSQVYAEIKRRIIG